MKTRIRNVWESRAPRERAILAALVSVVVVLAYVWLIQAAQPARQQLRISVSTLHAEAARMERQAAELARLRAEPKPPASQTDLRATVQGQTEAVGLSQALLRINVVSTNQVQVVFGAVSFADWLAWVATLQKLKVHLESCRIEALSAPGMVSATVTLTRLKSQ